MTLRKSEFAYWLSSVPSDSLLCDTVYFWSEDIQTEWAFANRISETTVFVDPDGNEFTCEPAAFSIDLPVIEGNGTVEMVVNFDSVDLSLFNYFDGLKGIDLNISVELYYSAYLLPGGERNPLLTAYPVFYVSGAALAYKTMSINAATRRLPNRKLGLPYTVADFPGLDIDY